MRRRLTFILIAAACLNAAAQLPAAHPRFTSSPDEPPPDPPILRVPPAVQHDALSQIVQLASPRAPLVVPAHPMHVGEHGVTAPKAVFAPNPQASEESQKHKIAFTGTVVIETIIGTDGSVIHPHVVKHLNKDLDMRALDAIRKWHFEPAQKNGQPVPVIVQIEIAFRLYDSPPK